MKRRETECSKTREKGARERREQENERREQERRWEQWEREMGEQERERVEYEERQRREHEERERKEQQERERWDHEERERRKHEQSERREHEERERWEHEERERRKHEERDRREHEERERREQLDRERREHDERQRKEREGRERSEFEDQGRREQQERQRREHEHQWRKKEWGSKRKFNKTSTNQQKRAKLDSESLLLTLQRGGQNASIPPVKDKRRFYVGREVLDREDLRSLKEPNWINDKVINAYMSVLQSQHNNVSDFGHIYILPSYLFSLWSNDVFDTWLFKKVKFINFKWIFIPINLNRNHWALMAINVEDTTVSVLDSMRGNHSKILQMWTEFSRRRSLLISDLPTTWQAGQVSSAYQKNGNACGAFVMLNALALTKSVQPSDLTHEHSFYMRNYVRNLLMTGSTTPGKQKTVCDALSCLKSNHRNQLWISCDVCGRWLHTECANVTDARNIQNFICVVCDAMYS